ncbi:WD40 repeat-containing protein [Cavenderia fasciculata]|uniref:WD40 repeat-containing protein n=1 Tax=Cavenderia fasciculata TaxID=261658 RepID=F4QFU2_CACFS|nr:WD40 repeat-containing protein [Cavenderia fasciculata]EGG14339.1 WD40 repeat-containing protein [Cavenderia fasciculata]|eukprot:XP_004351048.1 WD40 repeat-containing protein [Cavenderia fasciculata]
MNSNFETAELEQLLSFNTPLNGEVARWERKATCGDRFMPSLNNLSQFNLSKENSVPSIESALNDYYKDACFDAQDIQSKILSYKSKAPVSAAASSSLRVLYSQNKVETAAVSGASKKAFRAIPQAPERILDAPDIVDDYYLNLLDWSSQNVIAIPLGKTVYLWNATTSDIKSLFTVEGQDDYITSLQWTKDGQHLAVGTNSCVVQLWDVEQQKKLREMRGHAGRVGALSWNNYILSSGSADTNIFNHDVRIQNHHVSTLSGHTQEVCGLKWSHDGTQLASGGNDNIVNVWDVNNDAGFETPKFTFEQHTAAVRAIAWCPWEQNLLATGGGAADRTIRFWNTQTGACVNSIDTMSQVCSIQWSTHHKELVSSHGFSQNQLCVWKYPTMAKVAELTGHTSRALHTAISPDGETIVSASADETLRFWRIFEKESKIPSVSRKVKESSETSMMRSNLIR